jgi:hypothetical protein
MTDQKQSPADIASRALEQAKERLPSMEFRLFVYMFNTQYLHAQMHALGVEQPMIDIFLGGLAQPLIYDFAEYRGISIERAEEIRAETRQIVMKAFAAAVIEENSVINAIMERAEREAFPVPTREQFQTAEGLVPAGLRVSWQAVLDAERFHFMKAIRRITNGEPLNLAFCDKAK